MWSFKVGFGFAFACREKNGFADSWCVGWIDEFEVAVFLTETSTRHSILRKEKRAKVEKGRLGTTNGRLTGTRDAPVEVGEGAPGLLREESGGGENVRMEDIPPSSKAKVPKEESREELFVSDRSEDEESHTARTIGSKREKTNAVAADIGAEDEDDKKKLALDTTYDGFSIYGRILCLVVKRKGIVKGKELVGGAGQAMMEEWITSTQMGEGQMMDE